MKDTEDVASDLKGPPSEGGEMRCPGTWLQYHVDALGKTLGSMMIVLR